MGWGVLYWELNEILLFNRTKTQVLSQTKKLSWAKLLLKRLNGGMQHSLPWTEEKLFIAEAMYTNDWIYAVNDDAWESCS